MKALEAYKALNGTYPASANGGAFEVSTASPTTFMSALRTAGPLTSATPIDPANNANYSYSYFLYPAGFYSCDATRGQYYVFFIKTLESQAGNGHGPGFACGTQDFVSFGAYVMGAYTN